jgi:hypothetical protein
MRAATQFKILWAVIKLVTITVMNRLTLYQVPAEHFLHHRPMLMHLFTARAEPAIALCVNRAAPSRRL